MREDRLIRLNEIDCGQSRWFKDGEKIKLETTDYWLIGAGLICRELNGYISVTEKGRNRLVNKNQTSVPTSSQSAP